MRYFLAISIQARHFAEFDVPYSLEICGMAMLWIQRHSPCFLARGRYSKHPQYRAAKLTLIMIHRSLSSFPVNDTQKEVHRTRSESVWYKQGKLLAPVIQHSCSTLIHHCHPYFAQHELIVTTMWPSIKTLSMVAFSASPHLGPTVRPRVLLYGRQRDPQCFFPTAIRIL
jgi:hypothetical protein